MELTAADILQADDFLRERVDVPEWGGHVWGAAMDGAARDDFEQEVQPFRDDEMPIPNARARLLVRCLVDAGGQRLFSLAQIESLGQKNSTALQRVFEVAMRLNGLDKQAVEELEKN